MTGESAREVARNSRERAERLQRRAEMFDRGADGEEATAEVLAALPAGWTTIHDVCWPKRRLANIDHIVIGPGGIFVIDSKNWTGHLTVAGGHLRQSGRSREKDVAGAADAALAIAELAAPYARDVSAVLCFTGQDGVDGWCRDVLVCSTSSLAQMLQTRPAVFGPEQITDAWLRLDGQLRSAMEKERTSIHRPRPVHPMTARRATAGTSRQRRRRGRNQPSLVKFIGSLAVLGAFVLLGPTVATAIGGAVAGVATSHLVPTTPCGRGSATPTPSAQQAQVGAAKAKHQRPARKRVLHRKVDKLTAAGTAASDTPTSRASAKPDC